MERSRESFVSEDTIFPKGKKPETIEELACRVLFSEQLDEKIRHAPLSTTESSASKAPPSLPEEPVRSHELRFARTGEARPRLPGNAALVDDKNRGILLHFFANHELLAAELMALALLKFPDAPKAFREGLAKTLREEQRHTRWYLNRLEKCGVEFGQFPLNRFFWDAVSTMDSPIDYVSRLSLTFEQANLDYALHYSQILKQAGDTGSAAILHQIYVDEISHVGYGLEWFRKWKAKEESDWAALQKRLIFPLSPSRAKGTRIHFNMEGRKAAGFDSDYIHRLSLFERSKGRTPNVYWFNPDTENRIAALPGPWHPTKRSQSIVEDLEILTAFLARRDDVAVLRNPPTLGHLDKLRCAGFNLPEILPETDLSGEEFQKRKINEFRPWGLGPDLAEKFGFLAENSVNDQPGLRWTSSTRELFSKSSQVDALPFAFGDSHTVRSQEDLDAALDHFAQSEEQMIQLKRPFSTAGGGMRRITLSELQEWSKRGLQPKVAREGGILIEPFHNREFDFSVLFQFDGSELRRVGLTTQLVTPSGSYRGTFSFPAFCSGLDPEIARFLNADVLKHYEEESDFCNHLTKWLQRNAYSGPLCVDSYLYRDANRKLHHRIACEFNTRFSMGRVAHEIRRQIAPDCGLRFDIVKTDSQGIFKDEYTLRNGKMSSGTITLTEPRPDSRFSARITVAKRRDTL
ncbi:MAG: ferritin-like domain-containing protein [Verrucomicrobiales bacterium]|nr:ferritin-like domain-containing protein [Verrucomicrobiales bacterium]